MQVEYDVVGASYANALLDIAQSKNTLEAVHTDIDSLASLMKENMDVKSFLSNPTLPEEKKKGLVKRIASESGFNNYTVNFLNLLIDQNRINAIEEICDAFETKYCSLTDTQVAVLRLGNDAVAGLAALGPDPLAPGAACVDICVHPAHRSRAVELLTQVLPVQSHGRMTAYADPAQRAKIALLQDRGFREVTRWPKRLPVAPALSECADLIMFERRG